MLESAQWVVPAIVAQWASCDLEQQPSIAHAGDRRRRCAGH
jgi:hypothetical protein